MVWNRIRDNNLKMKTRAPPPEARRADPPQAGKRARQNAAKNPADLHAEGNARGGGERVPTSKRVGKRVPPGAQPWIPTTKCVGMTAGRGMASPRRRPRPAARAAGLWPKRGRPAPSDAKRSEGQRSGAAAPRVKAARMLRQWGGKKVAPKGGEGKNRLASRKGVP